MSFQPNFTEGEVNALKALTGRPVVDEDSLKAFSGNERDILAFFHSLPNDYEQGLYTKTAFLVNEEHEGGETEDRTLNKIKRDILIRKYGRAIAQDFVFAVTPIDVHNMIADELDFHVFVYPKEVFGWGEEDWVSLVEVFNREVPPQNKTAEILCSFLDTPVLPNDAMRIDKGTYRFQDRAPGAIALAKEFIDLGYEWSKDLQSYIDLQLSMDRKPYEPELLRGAIQHYEAMRKGKINDVRAATHRTAIKIKHKPRLG